MIQISKLFKGDKIKLVKPMGAFTNIGEICTVTDVTVDNIISFKFGTNGMHLGCMSLDEANKYFELYMPKPVVKSVDVKKIKDMVDVAHVTKHRDFDRTYTVVCELPSGFIISESSSCVDPAKFDTSIASQICRRRIEERLMEMEAYRILQNAFEERSISR